MIQRLGSSFVKYKGNTLTSYLDGATRLSSYGITGSGDERDKLVYAMQDSDGKTLDMCGLTVTIGSPISLSFSKETKIRNGKILYSGSSGEFAVSLGVSTTLTLDGVEVDANSLAAKALMLRAVVDGASVEVIDCTGRNPMQTDSTGLAAGIYATVTGTIRWSSVIMVRPMAYDVRTTKTVSPVGRGLMVAGSRFTYVRDPMVYRVAPYQDGDGIYVQEEDGEDMVFVLSGGYFEDCQKRSVKSQVKNTRVSDVFCIRTQAFPFAGGSSEIDLQRGGTLDGATIVYADGSAPQAIISGWNYGHGVRIANVAVTCKDRTDVISRLVQLYTSSADQQIDFVVDNITANVSCINPLFLYGTGAPDPNTYVFNKVHLRNIKTEGFPVSTASAVVQVSRGASAYVKANLYMNDCDFGSSKTIPFAYLDPAPGSTSYLDARIMSLTDCNGFDTKSANNKDASMGLRRYSLEVAENASGSITIPVDTSKLGRPVVKLLVSYNSNRDGAGSKLYTEGWYFFGASSGDYVESVVGVKTTTGQGTISVSANPSGVVVSKTAGSLSAGGILQVYAIHDNWLAL